MSYGHDDFEAQEMYRDRFDEHHDPSINEHVMVPKKDGVRVEEKKPRKVTLCFYECEHDGDLNEYLDDIRESGGQVINSDLNYDAETADVEVELGDVNEFLK